MGGRIGRAFRVKEEEGLGMESLAMVDYERLGRSERIITSG